MKQPGLGEAETMASPAPSTGTPSVELEVVARDRYEIEAELARGGMGRILRAVDHRHGRPVAIKELLTDTTALRARFRREALITARLQHPAIVPVYEAGVWPGGEPFYAMKMVNGRSLDAVIADRRTFEARIELLPNVIAVAEAIAYAHERKVIHRDLKPANVLVGDFGETVVIDWGLAKDLTQADLPIEAGSVAATAPGADQATAVVTLEEVPEGVPRDGLTVAGHAMGTPAYMAPEQARGELADERADVYALGGILYHLLTGRMPYADSKDGGALVERKRLDVPPTEVTSLEPKAPPDLVAIVAKAMARQAGQRYANAKAMVADLRRFENGQLVSVHDYTSAELIRRWLRRNRLAVAFAAVLVAVIAIGGTLAITRVLRERNRATGALTTAEAERARAEAQTRLAEDQSRLAAEERATAVADRERAEQSEQDAVESSKQAQASTQALVEGWVQSRFERAIRDCYRRGGKTATRHASLLLEVDDQRGVVATTAVHPFGTSADACIIAASKSWKFPPGIRPGKYGLNLMAGDDREVQIGFAASDAASIQRMMSRDYKASLERCYKQLLRGAPKATGKVEVAIATGEDGKAAVTTLRAFDPGLEQCVRGEIERWVFAPPRDEDGRPTIVTVEATTILKPPTHTGDTVVSREATGTNGGGHDVAIGTGKVDAEDGKGSGSGSGSGTTVANGPAVSLLDTDRAMIRRYIKRNISKIKYCYEKALLDDPTLTGTVDVSFRVGFGGKVDEVSATGMTDEVSSCVADVVRSIEFPSPSSGGSVNVSHYPFQFIPSAE